jgi:signal transduction histidine kinase
MQQVEKMSAMGQLAAGVAHQLNTPLGSALLRAQMLEEDIQDPEQREDLQFIQRQLRYGKEIVESLLRFSRPARGIKHIERLNPIIQGVLDMIESTAQKHHVRLRQCLHATDTALVYGGRNDLEQVLMNLCHNALDAMPQGGELSLSTHVQEGSIAIQVQDTGSGIPQARLPHIFEPFYTSKEPGKGTGLGLAICRRIIDEAGGSIKVMSTVGGGTTFTAHLPRVGTVTGAAPDTLLTRAAITRELETTAPHAKEANDGPPRLQNSHRR